MSAMTRIHLKVLRSPMFGVSDRVPYDLLTAWREAWSCGVGRWVKVA